MDCPRCDEPLVVYTFGDRRALGCEACGYVGVEVDHHAERREDETWAEALRRFARREDAENEDVESEEGFEPAIVRVEE